MTPEAKYYWKDKTVLIVEDLPHNYELLASILIPTGIAITWAKNGLEAIDYCSDASNPADLVLMDINLPIINGYVAIKRIKEIRPGLPVITQTAYGFEGEQEKSYQAGTDDYILKPIVKDILFAKMSKFLDAGTAQ